MIRVLLRVIGVLSVVFNCTIRPVSAQPTQTFTLNGMWVDVIVPAVPVRLGETFWISVTPRPHGSTPLLGPRAFLDARPLGRRDAMELTSDFGDARGDNLEWFSSASVFSTPGDVVLRITVSDALGRGGVLSVALRLLPAVDADGDTLPDLWEQEFGMSTESAAGDNGADGDPDGDGLRNRDEFLHHSHPRGFHARYFAEGVNDAFFETVVLSEPLPGVPARMTQRSVDADGWAQFTTLSYNVLASGVLSVGLRENTRVPGASIATIVESDAPFVAERFTKWPTFRTGNILGYGSHGSEGSASLSTRWLFAEGVIGAFHTYVTLLNPSAQTANLTVVYLGGDGVTQVVRQHTVAPDSRATIDVNADAAGLASTDLGIVIDSDVPIAAERSIYRDVGSKPWGAGTSSVGAPAAAVEWFFAEGLTNPLFDTYLLLLNPGAIMAQVEIEVLRADGAPITLTRTIGPRSRATIHMNSASPDLASSSFGLVVRSTSSAPIVAERTMWWNDPVYGTRWLEGHTSLGMRAPATRWFAPANWMSGADADVALYLLLANPGATPANVRVTLPPVFQGGPTSSAMVTVPPHGRATFDVTSTFVFEIGQPDSRRTPLLVESLGDTPAPIVVERSAYANTLDAVWELGSNTPLSPLPPLPPATP
jgi:hypothetical protein